MTQSQEKSEASAHATKPEDSQQSWRSGRLILQTPLSKADPQPPHQVPLGIPLVTLEAKELVETVTWLCQKVQSQHVAVNQLEALIQNLKEESQQRAAVAQQQDKWHNDQIDLLQQTMRQCSGNLIVAGDGQPLGNTLPRGDNDEVSRVTSPVHGITPAHGDLGRAVRALELEMATCQHAQKKLDQHVRHQENQQQRRDDTQDELLKLELQRISRDVEMCLKERDLEPVRSLLVSKVGQLETELKDEIQRISHNLRESLHAQIADVQSGIERIAGSTEQQVRLLDQKVSENGDADAARHSALSEAISGCTRDCQDLRNQVQYVAETSGIPVEELEEVVATADPEMEEAQDRGLPDLGAGGFSAAVSEARSLETAQTNSRSGSAAASRKAGGASSTPAAGGMSGSASKPGSSSSSKPNKADKLDKSDRLGKTGDKVGSGGKPDSAGGGLANALPQTLPAARPDGGSRGGKGNLASLTAQVESLQAQVDRLTSELGLEAVVHSQGQHQNQDAGLVVGGGGGGSGGGGHVSGGDGGVGGGHAGSAVPSLTKPGGPPVAVAGSTPGSSRPASHRVGLPGRIEKLEEAREELTAALVDTLGLTTVVADPTTGQAPGGVANAGTVANAHAHAGASVRRAPSQGRSAFANGSQNRGERQDSRERSTQALRLDAIEQRLAELGSMLGLEPPAPEVLQEQPAQAVTSEEPTGTGDIGSGNPAAGNPAAAASGKPGSGAGAKPGSGAGGKSRAGVSGTTTSTGQKNNVAAAGVPAAPTAPAAAAGAAAPQNLNAKFSLVNRKLEEVAAALGVSPSELEAAARSSEPGRLAGRVVLCGQSEEISPKMAGIIAAQEDRMSQTEDRISRVDDQLCVRLDKMDGRLGELNELESAVVAAASSGGTDGPSPLDAIVKRVHNIAERDAAREAAATGLKAYGPTIPAARDAAIAGIADRGPRDGSTKADDGYAPRVHSRARKPGAGRPQSTESSEPDDERATSPQSDLQDQGFSDELVPVVNEMRLLRQEFSDLRARVRRMASEMNENKDTNNNVGKSAPAASSEDVQRAEKAAKAAEASAKAAARLRKELEEILRAVEVPAASDELQMSVEENFRESELSVVPSPSEEALQSSQKAQAEATAEYVERQMMLENRLSTLEVQLDEAGSGDPNSELIDGMRGMVKDVRRCLQRCELLFMLPEIKLYVKKFQRSLQVNAILHERWVGPTPQKGDQDEEVRPRSSCASSALGEDKTLHQNDHTKSAPELSLSRKGRDFVPVHRAGKRSDGKKKPFRTVVDWCRPHTPLKIDPVFKGHSHNASVGASGRDGREERSPQLPQITR